MRHQRTASCAVIALGLLLMTSGRAEQQRTQPSPDETRRPQQEDAPPPPVADSEAEDAAERQVPTPIFRAGINYIRVDVIATDGDGNHVADLTLDDFEVYEDDVLQDVDSFQRIEVDLLPALDGEPLTEVGIRRSDQELAATQADARVFVIFLDDYHVREGNSIQAGMMLTDFLKNDLIPTDLVGVMYPLMPLDDVRLTRNHEAIITAVKQFRGVKYDYEVRNQFEERYNQYSTTVVERIRNDVSLSALRGLMVLLGGLREGRKSVLVVSEGYSNYVPPQLRERNAELGSVGNPSRGDPFAGDNPLEDTYSFFEQSTMMRSLQRVTETANRFNTSLYAVDPRGLAVFEFDLDQPAVSFSTDSRALRRAQDSLRVLAEQTDGRAIVNTNDLVPGLQQMLKDSSSYYLLGYNSSVAATDGKFHEIDVRVRREGLRVRARPGYWAITERDAERALTTTANEPPKAVDVALAALAEPQRGRLVRTWVGTAPALNGKTRVTFVWEPIQVRGRREAASRVLVTAMGDTGNAYFRGRIPEQTTGAGRGTTRGRNPAAPPPVTRVEFEADPGVMQMSLAIEDEAGAVLDRDLDEIEIPDFTGPRVVLSTPSFVRARNALELRSIVDDYDVPPTASRDFRRTDQLLVRFEAYAPGAAIPNVEVRLLNRNGGAIYPLDVQAPLDGHPFQVHVTPVSLPPGEYIIELRAATPDGEATQLIAFRLTS